MHLSRLSTYALLLCPGRVAIQFDVTVMVTDIVNGLSSTATFSVVIVHVPQAPVIVATNVTVAFLALAPDLQLLSVTAVNGDPGGPAPVCGFELS